MIVSPALRPLRWIGLLMVCLALSGCGQKGGLYLPKDADKKKKQADAALTVPVSTIG
ncbi:MAG: lipoprotein [Pseudomonadota bacterium]